MGIMNLAEIMDKAIDTLKKHIKTIIMFTLVYGLISFVAAFAMILIGVIFSAPLIYLGSGYLLPWIIIFFIVVIILTIFQTYNAGLIKISSQDFLNEKVSFEDGIKIAFKSIPKVFGVVFISAAGFLPIAGIFAVVIYSIFDGYVNSIFLFNSFTGKDLMFIITAVILVIAAYVIYSAYNTILCFSMHGVVIEKKGVFASIKRSFHLIKNNFWRIFGYLLLFSLTVYAFRSTIESFFLVLINVLYLLLKFVNVEPGYIAFISTLTTIIRWPLSIFSWLVITPIGTIMISILYFNQRFKKEGYDLVLRLGTLKK